MSTPMSPEAFAKTVRAATDEQLAAGLAVNRELILSELFRQMPGNLDSAAVGDLDAIVHWRIGGRPDGGHDVWQVTIHGGAASVVRDGRDAPTVTYTIDALDFLKLVAGVHEGPELFLFGKLVIEGDLVLAAQMPRLFRRPAG